MTMAPMLAQTAGNDASAPGVGEPDVRRCFASLRELAQAHGLSRLSMGMSQDFRIAVEEGATDVRIGTRLFA
ncbi:MAG: hypothetical protein H0V44_14535 [Planctomycetes bacterium]|nr:hypothetical protein [Planctomycetota bacterium]